MKKNLTLAYGIAAYLIFFGTFLYLIGFVGDLWVPKSVDRAGFGSALLAWLGNLLWIGLFGIQHSVMARPSFKAWWTRLIPKPAERSTYVLIASLLLIALFRFWEPIPRVIWDLGGSPLGFLLSALFWFGWALVLFSTYLINHFDLFGLRQVYLYWRGEAYKPVPFKITVLYRYTRHPLMLGFLVAFWAAPLMTVGHLLFAVGMTAYILIGIYFEERNLLESFGDTYRRYQAETPMLAPFPKFK